MPDPFVLSRLYPILDIDELERRRLAPVDVVDCWLDAGVTLFQLRAKRMGSGAFLSLANELVRVASERGCALIVNDRADVARMSGAAGVHLGQDDLTPTGVRTLVGPAAIIGLSTHNEGQLAGALDEPVNYVAIGPVFSTGSKVNPDPVVGITGVERAAALARRRGVPLVAIGGIALELARDVLDAGASSVAIISALLDGDPRERIARFLEAVGD